MWDELEGLEDLEKPSVACELDTPGAREVLKLGLEEPRECRRHCGTRGTGWSRVGARGASQYLECLCQQVPSVRDLLCGLCRRQWSLLRNHCSLAHNCRLKFKHACVYMWCILLCHIRMVGKLRIQCKLVQNQK